MATQLSTDYRGNDFTASITLGNPSIFTNSGVIVGQYLQSVTQRMALGAEVAYQYGPNVPGRQIAIVSALGRYSHGDSIWSGTLGPSGLHLCYYQKASEQLQIGVEVETSLRMQESVATIAYQIDLPKADLVFRGECRTEQKEEHNFIYNYLSLFSLASHVCVQAPLTPIGTFRACWRSVCSHCPSPLP